MSRSFHVAERQRKKDRIFNRDNSGNLPPELSKFDILSLKKLAAKWSEKWKRDAAKVAGIMRTKFIFDEDKCAKGKKSIRYQKVRGRLSDIPSETIEKEKTNT